MGIIAFILALIALFRPVVSRADINFLTKKIAELELRLRELEKGGQIKPAVAPQAEKPAPAQSAEPPQTPAAPPPDREEPAPFYVGARHFVPTVKDRGYGVPGGPAQPSEIPAPAAEEIAPAVQPAAEPQSVLQPVNMAEEVIPAPEKTPEVKEIKPRFTAPKIDWEMFTGAKLFSWLGGIALFIGIAFLVKYSIDNDLIKPWLRIFMGAAAGFGCIAGSLFIKQEKLKTTADTLAACGVAILYATVFAAQYFYNFISLETAFVLMSFVSLGGYLLAHYTKSKAVAVLSSVAGFMLPFIYNLPYERQLLVFGFIFILDAGAIASAVKNKWDIVVKVCAAGTFLITAGWFVAFFSADKYVSLITITTVFLCGAAFILIKYKEEFTVATRAFIKMFILCGALCGVIVFAGYTGQTTFWTGIYLMLLPVVIFKLAEEKYFMSFASAVMTGAAALAAFSAAAGYKNIISLLILPSGFLVWNIFKKDGEHNLRGSLNVAGVAAFSVMAGAVYGGILPYFLFGALAVLNIFNFIEEEQKAFRPWIAYIAFFALFAWALKSESLGVNTLIFVLGGFSVFNFILAKIGQTLKKDARHYVFALTLPFLSIVYLYINFRPDPVLVFKCSLFMTLMYGAAVYFTLNMKENGKFLYIPLASALLSLLMWNVSHLEPSLVLIAAVWAAMAVIIPFLTLIMTRFNEDKNIKNIFVYYILASMIVPVFMLQKTGGLWIGFGSGFTLTLLINALILFVIFDDKKNYGKTLLAYISAATFMAELVWMGSYYNAYNIFVILGVFAFFSVLYAALAFVMRKYETEEEDGPAGFFVLAGMVCVSFMTTAIAQSAQVVYGGFGFLLMSSVMLTALIYRRKKQGVYVLAMTVITFLFALSRLSHADVNIYMKAGILLPFAVFYFALTQLKGIKENLAKISASAFLTAGILLFTGLPKEAFFTSAGMVLFMSLALAYLAYKDKALYNVQFKVAGAFTFVYAFLCLDFRPYFNAAMVSLFFVLAVIYGLTDYMRARKDKVLESDVTYIISISAFYMLFAGLINFNTAFAYVAVISALYLWFNHKTNKQTANIAVFAGALLTQALLPSSAPAPGIAYVFIMSVMFMLPAFLSGEKDKNILYGIAYIAGLTGFVMTELIVQKYDFMPAARGLWPVLWAAVYGVCKYAADKKQENGNFRFLSGATAFALMVIAVPVQFKGQWITIFWAVEGLVFMVIGLKKSSKPLRLASMGLLMAVVFKLFFIDLWRLGGLYRIAAFIGTAVMLIGVSFFYQKFIREK
ncbi:MAG: DUF2339 domain-containing protein [Elusimicrobium sp.]|jgi:hypothetical protein|nr:DUF2339 domain-containing protein [Elusimicrobium sp.]